MKFAILLYAAPHSHQASLTAYRFAKAACAQGHVITQVFFYGDSVYHGCHTSHEGNISQYWQDLAEEQGIELMLCSTATTLRNVKLATELSALRIGGLDKLQTAMAIADRVIVFGD